MGIDFEAQCLISTLFLFLLYLLYLLVFASLIIRPMRAKLMIFFRHALLTLPIILALASCKDDPKLVMKRQEQEKQLVALDQEIQSLSQQLKTKPKDVSAEIAAMKNDLAALQKETDRLESEILSLREKKFSLEKEFTEYRKKYPIE